MRNWRPSIAQRHDSLYASLVASLIIRRPKATQVTSHSTPSLEKSAYRRLARCPAFAHRRERSDLGKRSELKSNQRAWDFCAAECGCASAELCVALCAELFAALFVALSAPLCACGPQEAMAQHSAP